MIAELAVVFVSLVVAMALGLGMGLLIGRRAIPGPDARAGERFDVALLQEVVAREAELIERLSRAEDDLAAHAVELADANEEIICLLDDLHEARSSSPTEPLP
ncbi:MAG: hypothetical protein AAF548_07440 [Actinomycetota bacterium]